METDILREFIDTVKKLHDPLKGCPADKIIKLDKVIPRLKAEVDEVVLAFEKKDFDNLKEEIGDVLLNIVHISEVAKRENLFDLSEALINTKNKIIRRHPHVWGSRKCDSPEEAEEIWNEIKQKEKLGLLK